MIKIRCVFFLCFLTLLSIVLLSCAKEEKPEKVSQPITITINNGPQEGDKNRLEEDKMLSEMFHQRYPQAELRSDPWQFTPESFVTRMVSNTCTDMVGLWASFVPNILEKGYALDITDYVRQWDKYEYLIPETLSLVTYKERIYGLPVIVLGGGYVMVLFYNKEMFKEAGLVDENGEPKPPQTWAEFVEYAQKLTNREKGIAGFGILGETKGGGWHFLNWVWQAGGDFEKKIDGKWTAVFDSPEAVQALQFIKDLRWKYDVLQSNLLATNDDLFEYFVAERIAMAIFTGEYLYYLVEKLKFPLDKIGICLLPAGPAGRANQMGGGYSIINPYVPEEKRQMTFNALVFNYELEVIEARCQLMQRQGRLIGIPALPIFKGEYQKKIDEIIDKYRNVPKYEGVMEKAVKYLRAEPPFYAQQLYGQAIGPAVQAVLTDKNADPAALLKRYAAEFQRRFLDKANQ